jgi:chitodextrinase
MFFNKQAYSPFGWSESTEVGKSFSDQIQDSEYYYGFSILLPTGWTPPYGWGLALQWYTKNFNYFLGPPPMSVDVGSDRFLLIVNTGLSKPNGPWEVNAKYEINQAGKGLNIGKWNDFILHIKWSKNSDGLIEAWHRAEGQSDFVKTLSIQEPTLRWNPDYNGGAADPIGLIKQGLYRNSKCNKVNGNIGEIQPGDLCQYGAWGTQPDSVIYHDGFVRGKNFNDVALALGASTATAYYSSGSLTLLYDANQVVDWSNLTANDYKPTGTSITYETRSSSDKISWSAWSQGISNTPNGRYIEIRANLFTNNTSLTPSIDKITLEYADTTQSSSGFTTNITQGQVITTPFTWTFDPGEPSVKGYFWADGKLLNTISGSPPYTWVLPSGSLTDGSHKLGHAWDTPDGQHKAPPSAYDVVIQNSPSLPDQDTTPPSAPSNLTATASAYNKVNLSWSASTDNVGIASYYIVRNNVTIAQTSGTVTTYSDTTVSPSTTYSYYVVAKDAAGNASGPSNTASVTTPPAPDTTPPSAPTNLTATAVSSSQINLSWGASTDNVGVTGYDIYQNGIRIATVSTTSYGSTGLSPSTTYSYYVIARDAAGNSSPASNTASATTQPLATTAGNLAGVISSSSGENLPGRATISLVVNGSTRTYKADRNGSYYISSLPAATYNVTYSAKFHASTTRSATITSGTTTIINVVLQRL